MIGAATIRRRLLQGDTYARIGADLGISPDDAEARCPVGRDVDQGFGSASETAFLETG
jgi:hypothetical protein